MRNNNNNNNNILDGMNKFVYHDDCQIAKLDLLKLYDSEGQCEGRTVVEVRRFT